MILTIENIIQEEFGEKSVGKIVFAEKKELVFKHFYELAEQGRGFAA